ncbi:MAG: universal stress protein [Phascolarctobacterium sp.]|nr:universal stress protein [Phascolarctobacterium sp.]
MSTFSKVLLATDMSAHAAKLTGCLVSLCPDTDTEIVLAHVIDSDDDADPHGSKYQKIQDELAEYKKDLLESAYEEISIITPKGDDPCDALIKVTEDNDIDMILVASHNKSFLKRALQGSTTFDLARETDVPLFISKDEEDEEDEEDLLDRVLVATDFSKMSLDALNVIRNLHEYVGTVHFLHVIEHSRNKEDYKAKRDDAETFLQELCDELKIFGIEAEYSIEKGTASKRIEEVCDKEKITLIMMGKTGADMDEPMSLGSTAENVVLNVDCATLLLPGNDEE